MGPDLAFEAYLVLMEEIGLEDEAAARWAVWLSEQEPATA